MFENKNNKEFSEFTEYLDEKRKYLAIEDLNDTEYQNFQSETIDAFNICKTLLDTIENYLSSEDNIPHFDGNELKLLIQDFYLKNNNHAQYFRSVVNELISQMANFCYERTEKFLCFTRQYREAIKDIRRRTDNLKDEFFKYSMQRSSLLSVVSPTVGKAKSNEHLENKYILYRDLVDETSDFSDSSNAFTIYAKPEFLAKFYEKYNKMQSEEISGCRTEDMEIKRLLKELSDKIAIVNSLDMAKSELLKIQEELAKRQEKNNESFFRVKAFNRITETIIEPRSKELNKIYAAIEGPIKTIMIHEYSDKKDQFAEKYDGIKKNHSYKNVESFISYAIERAREIMFRCKTFDIEGTINHFFSGISNSLKFFDYNERKNIPYMSEENLYDEITIARLLDLFFQAYMSMPGVRLSEKELIQLIRNNAQSVIDFVENLIEIIEDYLEEEDKLEENILDSDYRQYYNYIENNRRLTEQEVIDHVIRKVLDSTQKS